MAQVIYVASPLDRIVNVHFGGNIVVAQVPDGLHYLLSLQPPDPADGIPGDEQLVWSGTYDQYAIIPSADYSSRPFNTTANLQMFLPLIDGIADTSLLKVGQTYPISGTGIAPNTTMNYTGGGAGTMSNNASITVIGGAITLRIPIWEFFVAVSSVHFADGTTGTIDRAEFWLELELGDASYVRSPVLLYQSAPLSGLSDADKAADVDAHYADLLAEGYPNYWLYRYYRSTNPADYLHNGVNLGPFPFSIWQFWNVITQPSSVFLVNMSNTSLVQVKSLVWDEPFYGGTTGLLPGYIDVGGTKLTAYSGGTQFSLTVDVTTLPSGPRYGLAVKARSGTTTDPGTGLPVDIPAVPLWTTRIPPSEHPPPAPVEIARFDANGLVTAPALVPA